MQGTSESQRDKGHLLFVDMKPNLGLRVVLPPGGTSESYVDKRSPECLAVEKRSFLARCRAACLT